MIEDTVTYFINPSDELDHIRVAEGDNLFSHLYAERGGSFTEVLNKLIEYHNECVFAKFRGETYLYAGGGSDRGEWLNRELRPWKMASNTALTAHNKKLLESIIGMHNQIVSSYSQEREIV